MREATEEIVGETEDGAGEAAEAEAVSPTSESREAPPSPDRDPESESEPVNIEPAVFDGGESLVEPPNVAVVEVASAVELGGSDSAAGLLWSRELFDSNDVNVTPAVTIRLKLPTVADDAVWNENVGVVEAIVSASGDVEKVKLISPPESVHQAMILSAIKTWHFRPAERDGLPVRYRQLIPVAIPRQTA